MLREIRNAVDKILKSMPFEKPLKYSVELPPSVFDADVSTNVALVLAKLLKKNPSVIAGDIISELKKDENISDAVFKSGFINIKFSEKFIAQKLPDFLKNEGIAPQINFAGDKKILIEFVSANPTGPLHIGHGRGAVYGDSLAGILKYLGAEVEKEYYVNNIGNQMELLADSVMSYIEGSPLPENGYKGKYIEDIADKIKISGEGLSKNEVKDFTINKILFWIEEDLKALGVRFAMWFEESSLYEHNEVESLIKILKEKGFAYEQDGAVWFKSTAFSDDKDRVIKRADGRYTYLASDIAYHCNKYRRGYDTMIDIWGADHHGYVGRMKGSMKALGFDENKLVIILYQLVNIIKNGQKVTMSTRAGEFINLREVLDEVGPDAVRFFMLMRSSESHLDFDLDLAKKQAPENPVFYVQYAHARICSIFKEADKLNFKLPAAAGTGLLKLPEERSLIKNVFFFEDLVETAARDFAPHYITKYLQDISAEFHSYYNKARVITDDKDLSAARLQLCFAVRNVIKTGLLLLGISAPEKM